MKYTLKQLQVFAQTARFGNISRAADSLSLSQSAASNALKELESQFDIQLFDRVGKRLKLNHLGIKLRPMVEELLEQAQAIENHLAQTSTFGQLKLGATLTIGNYLIAGIMADYLSQHPGTNIDMVVANTQTIAARILDFELDAGLIEAEVNHPELAVERWKSDELLIFAAPNHPLSLQANVSPQDLSSAEWILREPGSGTRQVFERSMGERFNSLNIRLELSQTQAIKQAVKSGLGIGCLSKIVLAESFQNHSLIPLRVNGLRFHRHFYIVYHRQKYLGDALRAWLDTVKQH